MKPRYISLPSSIQSFRVAVGVREQGQASSSQAHQSEDGVSVEDTGLAQKSEAGQAPHLPIDLLTA
jgi:hypothetical protein